MKKKNKLYLILYVCFFIILAQTINAEIIKFSKLKKKETKFTIKRDLFTPYRPFTKPLTKTVKQIKEVQKKTKPIPKSITNEIKRRFIYEGYILKSKDNNYSSHQKPLTKSRWVYVLKDEEKKQDKKKKKQSKALIVYNGSRAVINVDGEYFVATAGDIILDDILIVEIQETEITIQADSQIVIIPLKEQTE